MVVSRANTSGHSANVNAFRKADIRPAELDANESTLVHVEVSSDNELSRVSRADLFLKNLG
jgi:hypothetical protein